MYIWLLRASPQTPTGTPSLDALGTEIPQIPYVPLPTLPASIGYTTLSWQQLLFIRILHSQLNTNAKICNRTTNTSKCNCDCIHDKLSNMWHDREKYRRISNYLLLNVWWQNSKPTERWNCQVVDIVAHWLKHSRPQTHTTGASLQWWNDCDSHKEWILIILLNISLVIII